MQKRETKTNTKTYNYKKKRVFYQEANFSRNKNLKRRLGAQCLFLRPAWAVGPGPGHKCLHLDETGMDNIHKCLHLDETGIDNMHKCINLDEAGMFHVNKCLHLDKTGMDNTHKCLHLDDR